MDRSLAPARASLPSADERAPMTLAVAEDRKGIAVRLASALVTAAILTAGTASANHGLAASAAPAAERLFARPAMDAVMTFNLRVDVDEGDRAWEVRRPLVVREIEEYQPLFLGTQEGLRHQLEDLRRDLPGYAYVGVDRRGGTEDEYSALFYDSRRARLVEGGSFWLSTTPQVAGSLLPGAGEPRMASWGRFRVSGGLRDVYVFNTHLALAPSIQARQAEILVDGINKIVPSGAQALVMGDLNAGRDSVVMQTFAEDGFTDSWSIAANSSGPGFSFHNWLGVEAGQEAKLIDWILLRPAPGPRTSRSLLAAILAPVHQQPLVSDHFPVVLTSLGEPKLAMSAVAADTSTINANAPLTVSATVRNIGRRGVAPLRLTVDGTVEQTRWLALDEGEQRTIEFTVRLRRPGMRRLSVDGSQLTPITVLPVPATLRFTDFQAPAYAAEGEAVTLAASVSNIGSSPGVAQAGLSVDGSEIATEKIAVAGGETREISFTHAFDRPGVYQLSVGGLTREVVVLRPLSHEWRFRRGDDPSWASASSGDGDWERVAVPEAWERTSNYTADHSFGWYRTSVVVPAEWRGRPVRFVLGKIDDVDQSFVNGAPIGQTGRLPTDLDGFESKWMEVRSYDVPPERIAYGAANSIAIRVYDETGGGGLYGGPVGILPLDLPAVPAQ